MRINSPLPNTSKFDVIPNVEISKGRVVVTIGPVSSDAVRSTD